MERSINFSQHRRGNILVGCGVVLVVLGIIAAIGVVWVVNSWRGWTASGITEMSREILQQSQIDQAEQQEMMTHVEDLMTRFENGDITLGQLGEVADRLTQSPLMAAALLAFADSEYISGSDLSDDEKAQARLTLARYTQGIKNDAIDQESLQRVLEPVSTATPDDNDFILSINFDANGNSNERALRSSDEVSGEDLREMLTRAKTYADEAGVDGSPEPLDPSDELAIVIAQALGEDRALPAPADDDSDEPEPDQEP